MHKTFSISSSICGPHRISLFLQLYAKRSTVSTTFSWTIAFCLLFSCRAVIWSWLNIQRRIKLVICYLDSFECQDGAKIWEDNQQTFISRFVFSLHFECLAGMWTWLDIQLNIQLDSRFFCLFLDIWFLMCLLECRTLVLSWQDIQKLFSSLFAWLLNAIELGCI
jgi:hypothetical protein